MNFKKNADGFAAFGGVSRVLNALLARFRGVCNRSNREADTEAGHISENKAEISEKAEESDISNTDDAEEPVTKPESKEERPSLIARLNEKKAVVATMDQKAPAVAKKKEEVIA